MKNFYLPTLCLASISPFAEIASADVFVVPGQYPTITQAISAAESAAFIPHTIVVGPGTYTETLIINRPNISLLSTDGSDVTIVDGTNLNYRCIEVKESADNFELDGFTVQNGDANSGSGGGIFIGSPNAEINSCVFRENESRRGAGLGASELCELSITDCSFVQNTSQISGSGIGLALLVNGDESPTNSGTNSQLTKIYNCNFEDNFGGEDINAFSGNIDLQNSTFTHTVTSSREIVYSAGRSSNPPYRGTKIKNCTFNLPAYWNSYAVQVLAYNGAGSISVEGCSFINGGLNLSIQGNSNINGTQVSTCNFEECDSYALRADSGQLQASITDCQFTETNGSAIFSGGNVSILNCTFSRNANSSNSTGSAIAANGTGPSVGNSFFCENSNPTISGNYESLGGNLFPPTCELAIGACCLSTSCVQLTEAACGEAGGQFAGFGTLCASIECFESDPTGACCINGSAIALKQSECDLVLGEFQGAGSTPDGVTCEPTDSCPQDLNNSGSIDYADLLEVLSAWGPCSG